MPDNDRAVVDRIIDEFLAKLEAEAAKGNEDAARLLRVINAIGYRHRGT